MRFRDNFTLEVVILIQPWLNSAMTTTRTTPFHGTEADMHRHNAALFAARGQTDRYLLALRNVARTEGTMVVAS